MLAKKFRLSRQQINLCYQKGKSQSWRMLGLKTSPNGLDFCRFAVIIPQKVIKKIVERNRLRRVIFSELEQRKSAPNNRGYDVLIRLFEPPTNEEILRKKIQRVLGECLNI